MKSSFFIKKIVKKKKQNNNLNYNFYSYALAKYYLNCIIKYFQLQLKNKYKMLQDFSFFLKKVNTYLLLSIISLYNRSYNSRERLKTYTITIYSTKYFYYVVAILFIGIFQTRTLKDCL